MIGWRGLHRYVLGGTQTRSGVVMDNANKAEEFEVTFHGPAVVNHSMSARDFGESMIALGQLVEIASEKLHGTERKGELLIKAPKPGSLEVVFQYIGEQGVSLFHRDPVGVIQLLLGGSGASVIGLFQLYKRLKGKRPERAVESDGNTQLEIGGNNNTVNVFNQTYNLYIDPEARRITRSFVAPLNGKGIDRMEIKRGDHTEVLNENEFGYYEIDLDGEHEINETTQDLYVNIVSLSFNPDFSWRVSTGEEETSLSVKITDQDFMKKVAQGSERFRKGDTLYVQMKTTQSVDEGKIKTEREICKVYRHINKDEQIGLDLEPH